MYRVEDLPDWISKKIEISVDSECWLWTGRTNADGYAHTSQADGQQLVHRIVYQLLVGPIPDNLVTDHLCHSLAISSGECSGGVTCLHRRCINPLHLEIVDRYTNNQRSMAATVNSARQQAKTHCKFGHPFSGENLYETVNKRGGRHRQCRICRKNADLRHRAKLKAKGNN